MRPHGVGPDALADEPRGRARLALLVLTPPVAWSLHLLLCYLVVTLDCTTGWNGSGWSVAALTLLFVAASMTAAVIGWRRRAEETDDTHELEPDRRGPSTIFLHRLAMTGGVFFAATIVVTGLAPLFVHLCP